MYGVKKGVKSPGEFNTADMIGFAFSGAAGIIVAMVTDFQQRGELSSIYTINRWVATVGDMLGYANIPLWVVVLVMASAGAASIFYFQPITRQGAFAQGAGLLAVLVTAIPGNIADGLEGFEPLGDSLAPPPGAALETPVNVKAAGFGFGLEEAGAISTIIQDRNSGGYERYDMHLTINFPNGLADDFETLIRRGHIRGRVHNLRSRKSWDLFRNAGAKITRSGNSLRIHAGIPSKFGETTLLARIEAAGYRIEESTYSRARVGETIDWTITMSPSSTPLLLQRLGKSYRY